MHVVLAAGGTGGHIEPALNVADALRRIDPGIGITVLGSDRGLESTLVPERGYDLVTVASVPMPRRASTDLLKLGPLMQRAVRQATGILRDLDADVVVGFGGYASVPAYLAARRTRTPLIIHESNARPGIANRLGARFTSHVYASYPGTLAGGTVMAPPLRASIAGLDRAAARDAARASFGLDPAAPVLLVFGGSQGARRLNDVVAAALPGLREQGVQVLHSFGSRNEPPAPADGYVAVPYLDRMDLAYAAADLAMTRAGAMTCAELAAVGLPAVYVPLPIGNGEQRLNAEPVVAAGGGLLVDDGSITAEWLTHTVASLLHDDSRLSAMGAAAYRHGVRDADEQLARIVLRVGGAS
ncbi:MAG: UDP-N-acetylglucosamine--N-acetylmuramyl-(pentapeptide) pyrophosphoryl-undecaprenol [Actinomycetota bacterium]|jgi:UDP-N-acetylglucosamine--N-acetylmuramyl-(pentapeptide) pyrophosphoryl-undecaprenol N-acetylglucosamine transferase|nr:UDP-N-acetylglucosamine--N-acetylmuramyl-(pentapeptide) pyrophosphoryl-undecaprenol [Actinomycetota bacterium]